MDYEKAYKDALERMKSWAMGEHPECFTEAQKAAEFIFPELKESEDERISREITEFILTHRIDTPNDIENTDSWLAWLEKQGDNPADVGLAELGKVWEEEHLQVDAFDAELNALLKKYEHLQKYEIIGCLNFYIKVVEKTENDDNTKRH